MSSEPDYEPLRRSGGWKIPLIVAAVALLALFGTQRFYRYEPPELITPASAGRQPPPTQLADGSAPPEAPEELAARFGQPVVMTAELQSFPPRVRRRCARVRLPRTPAGENERRRRVLQALVDDTDVTAARVGPSAITVLRLGRAPSPPGFPGIYQQSCVAVATDDGWRPGPPLLFYARDNIHAGRGPGRGETVSSVLLRVPEGATWAVQEQSGWWLAHEVTDDRFVQLTLNTARPAQSDLRVVFLDDEVRVVDDRTVQQPGQARLSAVRAQRLGEELVIGRVKPVLRRLERRPIRRCSSNDRLCVWITRSGSDLFAIAAFGPLPLDTPPFGFVGWCPPSRSLQGSTTDARFTLDGRATRGQASRGPVRYRISYNAQRRVVVNLGSVEAGPPRQRVDRTAVRGPVCDFGRRPVGNAPDG